MKNFLYEIVVSVAGYLEADWHILLAGILIAVFINVYIDPKKLKSFLETKAGISIPGAVTFGALTPLCACGTMAVLLSMFISAMPWGPVMAFLISSPLTSPEEFMFETAFLGFRFAAGMLILSIALGLTAGFSAHWLDKKTSFFKGQFRMASKEECSCSESAAAEDCGCSESSCCSERTRPSQGVIKKYKLDKFAAGLWDIGVKKILLYFIVFIAIGKVVELMIPKEWIMALFSSSKSYSIPLAATIGLPLYLNNASAMPLLKTFITSGAGEGAVMAFLIAGKATGVPVITGMSVFLKKRALLFYIGFIYIGAIVSGFLYQLVSGL